MKQPTVLMYHWFRGAEEASVSKSPQLEITPELFEQQMRHLQEREYRTVGLADAIDTARAGKTTGRPIVISFDDGTLDFWEHARPILNEIGFKATLFIVTGFVGAESSWDEGLGEPARPLMSWDQIATLQEEGHEIGSHSHTHRVFTELEPAEVTEELETSRDTIEKKLGRAPELFAYPRGFHDKTHKALVDKAGYKAACGVILKWSDLRATDEYALRRMTIKGNESMLRFALRLKMAHRIRCRT